MSCGWWRDEIDELKKYKVLCSWLGLVKIAGFFLLHAYLLCQSLCLPLHCLCSFHSHLFQALCCLLRFLWDVFYLENENNQMTSRIWRHALIDRWKCRLHGKASINKRAFLPAGYCCLLVGDLWCLTDQSWQAKECLKVHWLGTHKMRAQTLDIPKQPIWGSLVFWSSTCQQFVTSILHRIHQGAI